MSANKRTTGLIKDVDELTVIRCASGDGLIREEVWKDSAGKVVRYNLAFINLHLFAGDNGRVLGYDNAHGSSHRHYAGKVEHIEHAIYDDIFWRFVAEVSELKTRRKI